MNRVSPANWISPSSPIRSFRCGKSLPEVNPWAVVEPGPVVATCEAISVQP